MIIGWLCKGYTHLNVESVDGMLNIRVPLLNMLLKEHKIIWLGHERPERLLHKDMYYFPITKEYLNAYKKFEKTYKGERKVATFFTTYMPKYLPPLDILLVEISRIHVYAPLHAAIISLYKKLTNAKIILWDTDRWLNDFNHWLKPFGLNGEKLKEFEIFAPYKGNTKYAPYLEPECYNLAYFPYDKSKELPIKDKNGMLCYIGNDYRRRPKMEKYYNFWFANMYGKYEDKEWMSTMKCHFRGRITPDKVRETYSKYAFCVQIVKKDYEKFGLMTPRINEVLEAGTICLVDGDILTAELFVDREYIVNDKNDILWWKEYIEKMPAEIYESRVLKQREKIKRFCNYDKLLDIFSLNHGQIPILEKISIRQQKSLTDFF